MRRPISEAPTVTAKTSLRWRLGKGTTRPPGGHDPGVARAGRVIVIRLADSQGTKIEIQGRLSTMLDLAAGKPVRNEVRTKDTVKVVPLA